MRILYVTEEPLSVASTGGTLRRNGVLNGLQERGVVVDVVVRERPAGLIASRLGVRHRALASASEASTLIAEEGPAYALLDGLPLAPAAAGLRRLGVRCAIDLCDSWLARISAVKQPTSWLAVELLMRRYVTAADALLYISDVDRTHDRSRFRSLPPAFVVPNGVATELFELAPAAAPGPAVFAADFRYPPNLEALDWLFDAVWPHIAPGSVQLFLFGPVAPTRALPDGVEWRGYAQELSDVYAPASVVIAPIRNGAGIKNKVIEAAAAGRPIVATSKALVGLDDLASVVAVCDDPHSFARAMSTLALEPKRSAREVAAARELMRSSTWSRTGALVEEVLARAC